MTTIYETPSPGQGTHALVIGVGDYPHLIDGKGSLAAKPLGLGQLTSPPLSAAAVAKWFLGPVMGQLGSGFANSAAPLASLELLISAGVPVKIATPTGDQEPERATIDHVGEAFARWLQRLKVNNGNIGVFYFCGHGVMVDDHFLLAEDFGANDLQPGRGAFNVSLTVRALQREVKSAMYFLVDACRETSRDMALTLGAQPQSLMALDLTKRSNDPSTSLIWATGEGRLAFAEPNAISRFTAAALTALSGYCGVKVPGSPNWAVDGETLAAAVRKLLEIGSASPAQRQVTQQLISGPSLSLVQFVSVPKVKVSLDMRPEARKAGAYLYMRASANPQTVVSHDAAAGIFETEVARGFYSVGACESASGTRLREYTDEEVMPPLYGLCIEVNP